MKKFIIVILLSFICTNLCAKATIYHIDIEKSITKKDIFYYAKRGNPKALYDLAVENQRGINRPINRERAFYYFHKSAVKNYAPAQFQLGMAFRNGIGIRKNQELARYWIRKSAKNRYRDAINIFNRYYSKKQPIKQFNFRTIASL